MKRFVLATFIIALILLAVSCTNHGKDNDNADTGASSHTTESTGNSFNTTTDDNTVGTDQTNDSATAGDTDATTKEVTSGTTVTQQQIDPPTVTTQTETGTDKKPPEETSSSAVESTFPSESKFETDTESLPVITSSDGVDLPLDVFD